LCTRSFDIGLLFTLTERQSDDAGTAGGPDVPSPSLIRSKRGTLRLVSSTASAGAI